MFIFWTRLISIDLSEINEPRKPQIIEANMLRIDDLQLLFVYCQKVYLDIQNGMLKKEPDDLEKY